MFAFQKINVAGLNLQIFFDSGCGDLVARKDCVDKLKLIGRDVKEYDGPITLNGVGNQTYICQNGIYSIRIPLKDGSEAKTDGVCVDEITLPFPIYPLKVVEQDIIREVGESNKNLISRLPKLPKELGGQVDIMIGKHYLKYFPLEITRLKSGLTLYDSMFKNVEGSTGVVSGPHSEFSKSERASHFSKKLCHYTPIVQNYFTFLSTDLKSLHLGTEIHLLILSWLSSILLKCAVGVNWYHQIPILCCLIQKSHATIVTLMMLLLGEWR